MNIAVTYRNTLEINSKAVPYSIYVLKQLIKAGHNIVVFEEYARQWLEANNVSYVDSEEFDFIIDYRAIGTPLSYVGETSYVDWYKVETILRAKNLIIEI